jgi:signal transduction histidine kinase/putative methionine-R-sulfoxide reductase with GAF domain
MRSRVGPSQRDREARRLAAFASIAAGLAHARDLSGALSDALRATLDALDLEAGGLYLLDEASGELRATEHHFGLSADYPEAVARFQRGEALIGRALDSVRPVVVADIAASAGARDATRRSGLRSVVFVPLYARGHAVGMMPVGGYARRDFAEDEIELLGAVGGMLGAAIDNARLVERARRHLVQVQALWEIDKAIVEDRDLTEVFGTIARAAARLSGGEAVIVLLDGTEDAHLGGGERSRALELLGDPPTLAGTPLAAYLARAAPTTVRLGESDDGPRAIVVPLAAGGRTLGGLVVVSPATPWGEEDLATLATFGRRAAVALAEADARQAEDRRAGQLALLAGASAIAASTLDVDALLGAIARYVQRSLSYYSVSVYLVRPDAREAHLAGAAGAAATVMPKGHRMPFGSGIIGWVAEHGEHILASDVRREPRFLPSALTATLSELAVPVRLTGEVVAVVNVESDRVDAFDEGDVVALDGIAAQVAAAIQNARLFDEKVRALRNLEIVQEITNVLNSELELDVLLERIARRSVEAVRPAQMGAVLLYDGESLRVRSSFGYAQPAALQKVRLAFHEGLPGTAFVSGHGRLVGSGAGERRRPVRHPAFREAAGGVDPRSALCVPIALPQEKLGVLLLESTTTSDDFEIDDLRFAETLAAQAAIAIGNALRLRRIIEMDRQRQEYLSNVSHELRSPLTVIQGYLEALADGGAGDQAPHYTRVAREHCQRLGRMIDEVLHVSRLEQGLAQRHVEWAPVSLAHTVRSVINTHRQEATAKGLQLASAVEDEVPVLAGDERLLQSLVFHLVENAVKFALPGGRVDVGLHADEDEVVLSVGDDGIGIAPEFHDRIFEKFFMVDAGPAKAHSGAGIGLFLVKEVVAIHGGAIRVESAPGQGSRFEVRLPIRPSD